jgi:diacylglycerol kinase
MKRIEINQMEFIDGGRSAKDNASCALALVGLVAAGVGLATLTVGTGGAAL